MMDPLIIVPYMGSPKPADIGKRGKCRPSTHGNVFIQIDNSYVGRSFRRHSYGESYCKQAGKNIIVVDEDIDIFDLKKVAWAFAYR